MFNIPYEYSEAFAFLMYFAPAFISLAVLFFAKRKLIWLSIPITIIADLLAFWSALTYYEFWQLALLFLIPQIIIVTIISLIIMLIYRKS